MTLSDGEVAVRVRRKNQGTLWMVSEQDSLLPTFMFLGVQHSGTCTSGALSVSPELASLHKQHPLVAPPTHPKRHFCPLLHSGALQVPKHPLEGSALPTGDHCLRLR